MEIQPYISQLRIQIRGQKEAAVAWRGQQEAVFSNGHELVFEKSGKTNAK
jgi:hypothetical protein